MRVGAKRRQAIVDPPDQAAMRHRRSSCAAGARLQRGRGAPSGRVAAALIGAEGDARLVAYPRRRSNHASAMAPPATSPASPKTRDSPAIPARIATVAAVTAAITGTSGSVTTGSLPRPIGVVIAV